MVEETFDYKQEIFSKQLEFDFSDQSSIYEGRYDQERLCVCFFIGDSFLEIPKNWGPFKSLLHFDEFEFSLYEYNDSYGLLSIFTKILNQSVSSVCFKCLRSHLYVSVTLEYSQTTAA